MGLGGGLQWVLQEGDIMELEFLQNESVHLCRVIGVSWVGDIGEDHHQ